MKRLFTVTVTAVLTTFAFTFILQNARAEEAVEEVQDVEVVDVQDGSVSEAKPLSFMEIVGRNHAAAVHLPIGLLFALCLVEVLRVASKKSSLEGCGFALSIAAALSFLPAAVTGLLRANELFADRDAPNLFFEHRNLMFAALAVLSGSLVLRIAKKNHLKGKLLLVYLVLLAGALLLTAAGAHHGGALVYGEQFLPY